MPDLSNFDTTLKESLDDLEKDRLPLTVRVKAVDDAGRIAKEAELAGDIVRALSTDTYLEIEEVGLGVDDRLGNFIRIEAKDIVDARVKLLLRKNYFSGQSIRSSFHVCAHKDNYGKAEKDKVKCTFEVI